MKKILVLWVALAVAWVWLRTSPALAHEFSGYLAAEGRWYPENPNHFGQRDQSAALAVQPEYYHEWDNGSSFTFVPFYRWDSADSKRTHFDVREMTVLWLHDDFELRLGVRKVFWGVTEFVHLVDIINQTDLVENIDGEEKLGQPMVNLSLARDWGTLDLFVLPFFRERTFPGSGGRLRFGLVVDTENPQYESAAEEWHADWAARYSHTFGDWDVGLHYFIGTGRDPSFTLGTDGAGNPVIFPVYQQIQQTGIDISYVAGSWLWKLEALFRKGQGDRRGLAANDYVAATGGFEYTLTGVFGSQMDLGIIGEYLFDDRKDDALTPFANDLGFGLRLAANDPASTEFLIGGLQDVDSNARFVFIEAGRRLGDHWKLILESRIFMDQEPTDFLFGLRDDDLVQLELKYYF
ncbi:MAG: hypothetical protein GWM98_23465 [Nitrospinaceae bacterium]|nr:hypothetical protein [Nitrospinaceae bacterium]NIT84194.1 hypothetical protein [Nitrospinaceae bacterium]NIU46378.1 hypothetical protein [Nitrospinaceae bacterium]NIW07934.1 hypothetical protein [Nitrospinaceae bacterium]NIW61120.1 hypothetical protein [Nitrospinaceae bacterium]